MMAPIDALSRTDRFFMRRQEELSNGYLAYVRYHKHAVIAAFRNEAIAMYSVVKFDFEKGVRWMIDCPSVFDAAVVLRRFGNIRHWKVSPRSAYWRNMPPDMALLLKSRGVDDIYEEVAVFDSLPTKENVP